MRTKYKYKVQSTNRTLSIHCHKRHYCQSHIAHAPTSAICHWHCHLPSGPGRHPPSAAKLGPYTCSTCHLPYLRTSHATAISKGHLRTWCIWPPNGQTAENRAKPSPPSRSPLNLSPCMTCMGSTVVCGVMYYVFCVIWHICPWAVGHPGPPRAYDISGIRSIGYWHWYRNSNSGPRT